MRGHIVKRSKSSWTIVLDLERNPSNGKRRQKWVSVKGSRKEAERRLSELLHQLDQGMPVEVPRLNLRDYLEAWLSDSVSVRNRPRTVEGYVIIVRKHILPNLGAIQLAKLQPSDVERMEARLLASGLSANTVHHVHGVLAKALKDAMRKGMLQRNVCQQFDPPKPGRYEVKVPDESGIRKILDLARSTPYGPIFEFMAFTGCRRGEALALLWKNIDLERGIASITETVQRIGGRGLIVQPTKSSAGRRGIALTQTTIDMLRASRGQQLLIRSEIGDSYNDKGIVFTGSTGGYIDPSVLTHAFEKLARKAGYPEVRLHDLRHGHAAGLVKAGTHPKVIQERLGHASAAFTMQVYGHVGAGMQQQAAEAFALQIGTESKQ